MKLDYYRYRVGEFNCVSVSDGGHNYPLKNMFSNVSMERVEEARAIAYSAEHAIARQVLPAARAGAFYFGGLVG